MNTISFQHTLKKVLSGEKTQTRRLFKPEWEAGHKLDPFNYHGVLSMLELQIDSIFTSKLKGAQDVYTDVFKIGGVHSVVEGRSKSTVWYIDSHLTVLSDRYDWYLKKNRPAMRQDFSNHGYKPLQIRVTQIRVEDVRNISPDDVKAEGFTDYVAFMRQWLIMHDKPAHKAVEEILFTRQMLVVGRPNYLEDVIHGMLKERPDNRYQAVVLDFEVVK